MKESKRECRCGGGRRRTGLTLSCPARCPHCPPCPPTSSSETDTAWDTATKSPQISFFYENVKNFSPTIMTVKVPVKVLLVLYTLDKSHWLPIMFITHFWGREIEKLLAQFCWSIELLVLRHSRVKPLQAGQNNLQVSRLVWQYHII